MLYGVVDGTRRRPEGTGDRAECPDCALELLAKCGEIVIWHWAHRVDADCKGSEPETDWHREWKLRVPPDCCEVRVGRRRADICFSRNGYRSVYEIQHSPLTAREIEERERDYKLNGCSLSWIWDARDWDIRLWDKEHMTTFSWKRARPTLGFAKALIFLDLGDEVFLVRKMYWKSERWATGWGHRLTYERMLDKMQPQDDWD